MRVDDTRLGEVVKIRIEVGRGSLLPIAKEQSMSLKELMAVKKDMEIIDITGIAKKNTEVTDPDGSGKPYSEQKSDLVHSSIRCDSSKTSDKSTSRQNGRKIGGNVAKIGSKEDKSYQAARNSNSKFDTTSSPVSMMQPFVPFWMRYDKEHALDLFGSLMREFLTTNPKVGDDSMGDGLARVLERAVSVMHGEDKESYFQQAEQIKDFFMDAEEKDGVELENVVEFIKMQNVKLVV